MPDEITTNDQMSQLPPSKPPRSRNLALLIGGLILIVLIGIGTFAYLKTTSQNAPPIQVPINDTLRTGGQADSALSPPIDPSTLPSELITPSDIVYKGAFRLPEPSGGSGWGWSGYAATYYPGGDANGPADGYPGSLFATGHDYQQMVSEVSIPAPVISKNLEDLNTATTLQPFAEIRGTLFGEQEIPRYGLAYLPAQAGQTSGKLYFSSGAHYEEGAPPTHGWSELTLLRPQTAGAWYVDGFTSYATNDYMFEIPSDWADMYVQGRRLGTGRFRDGNWSGRGPALFAIGPWQHGNPPKPNTTIDATPLLLYGIQEPGNPEIVNDPAMEIKDFSESDEWSGAEWLTKGDKAALVFFGTKALGETWYGFGNGVVYPTSGDEDEVYPDVPDFPFDQRGWWSEGIQAQMIFYNPADLAAVAQGKIGPHEPQPYATLNLDPYMIDPGFDFEREKKQILGAPAFDREHGLIYLFERRADSEDDLSVVHVFAIQ